jgi:hypothetical protein
VHDVWPDAASGRLGGGRHGSACATIRRHDVAGSPVGTCAGEECWGCLLLTQREKGWGRLARTGVPKTARSVPIRIYRSVPRRGAHDIKLTEFGGTDGMAPTAPRGAGAKGSADSRPETAVSGQTTGTAVPGRPDRSPRRVSPPRKRGPRAVGGPVVRECTDRTAQSSGRLLLARRLRATGRWRRRS